ncbi:serine hydrolase [Hymenobacter sp. H14-R3]|uniref:serine hydrolase domain-containing protein n=1 Tax=Hymenobacter sp. H14-R3 TaxID=3046308 RepID=UPI0024B92A6A|nr:serine hydrolase [Hymenobacter sp. H14-R3]MDJ0366782.1 serine hydrolase [Hymenobacter sp. H14-R3]
MPDAAAQNAPKKYLSAAESDPLKMGWMQGFPPPPSKVLRVEDGSFMQFPALRWSVVHMRQMLPSVNVPAGLGAPGPLPTALDTERIDALTFQPWGAAKPMTWQASLAENYTDGMLIMHRGKIVYERYFGALTPTDVHAVMSLTKSFTGTLAAMLVAEGKLDETRTVASYMPELQKSGFGDATVRQVMDMTTGLKYSEEYADPKAEVWQFSAAGNPFKPQGYTGPNGYYAYLETVKKQGQHGEAFGYRTINADALGWIIARASGQSVAELLSERVWRKIGAEQAAFYQVDGLGTPFAGGGLNAGLRDLARFGELIRNEGRYQGQQLLPAATVQDIRKGGSKAAFAKSGHPELKGWSYRDMWWMTENAHGAFAARGVYGQTIYIDPAAEMVLVRLASHPVAANAANDPTSLPAYEAVAEYLMKQK